MKKHFFLFAFILHTAFALINASNQDERKVISINGFAWFMEEQPYIVYLGDLPRVRASAVDDHHILLSRAVGDERIARESRIHSYGRSFNGFAARMLPHEVEVLSKEDGVVSVFPSRKRKLHTTRSWDFLGMPENLQKRNLRVESDLIVGMLDTGIYMEAPSFGDEGYGPPPVKWKGSCVTGANFTGCNNKVIGAKFFNLEDTAEGTNFSPADTEGHGTHTSSTVAGMAVEGASFYGIAEGTARGGVPMARLAMYKVCWENGCTDMDILAGFDNAIADGVDLISISIGGASNDYFTDSIAIGSFHAMKNGILTSCSGGNSGPLLYSVENVAPWMMTVAASSIDRQFNTMVKLGNGKTIPGVAAINTFTPKEQMSPLISGTQAGNVTDDPFRNSSTCDSGSLAEEKVKGKIVFCNGNYGQDYTIRELGGVGVITTVADGDEDFATTTEVPGASVTVNGGNIIAQYLKFTKNPRAVIYKTVDTKAEAPFLASFSSRGPQIVTPNILKPDIAAPGLDILAAYSKLATVTDDPSDKRYSVFNIISGTSMACPHATAAAAYVKSFHPDWSPAAIKSAIMTTATQVKFKEDSDSLGAGAGQLNPAGAVHPGLVYDLSMMSYIRLLCKQGYDTTTINLLVGGTKLYNCSKLKHVLGTDGLNYPTFHTQISADSTVVSAIFYRTVTHVGFGGSMYKSKVTTPEGLSVEVIPETLEFGHTHEKKSFKVVVKGSIPNGTQTFSGSLEWNDHKHSVRSTILIYRGSPTYY